MSVKYDISNVYSACSKKLAEWQETQGDMPRIASQRGAILGGGGGGGRSPQQLQQQTQQNSNKIQTQPNIQSSSTTTTASSSKERETSQTKPLTEKKLSPVISDATNGMSKIRRKTKYPLRSVSLIMLPPL